MSLSIHINESIEVTVDIIVLSRYCGLHPPQSCSSNYICNLKRNG